MVNLENMHISKIIWNQLVIFRNIFAYRNTYMHTITINEKRGHGFAEERGGVFDRVWRKGRNKCN